ncbi:MAG: hypothetical protein ABI700_23880, partial [Chloroflexota bacterium]
MKVRLLLLAMIIYVVIILPVSAQTISTPTLTATPTPIGSYVVAQDIYVRGGPGETYLPVGRLVANEPLLPTNRSDDGQWVMIRYYKSFGWIRRDLAYWDFDVDTLPSLDQTDLTPTSLYLTMTLTPVPTGVEVSAGEAGAFVRFGPGGTFPYIGAVVSGEYVEPVGQNVGG